MYDLLDGIHLLRITIYKLIKTARNSVVVKSRNNIDDKKFNINFNIRSTILLLCYV